MPTAPLLYTQAPLRYSSSSLGTSTALNVPDYAPPVEPDTRSELRKGWDRGVDTTQALLGGALALFGDTVGSESIRDFGYDYYQEQMAEAAQSPAAVPTLHDINGVSSFFDWVLGKTGELAPSMLEAAAASVVGATVGNVGGAVIGATSGRSIIKSLLMNLVKRNLAKGLGTKAAAESALESFAKTGAGQLVKRAMRQQAAKLGAQIGVAGFSTAIESGGNWIDDYETNGDGTNPVGDLFFGTLSGLSEVVGVEGQTINRLFGGGATRHLLHSVGESGLKKIDDGFRMALAKEIAKNTLAEGGQEGLQESLSVLNSYLNTHSINAVLTPEVFSQVMEAAAAGALGGFTFGIPSGLHAGFSARAHADQVVANQKAEVDQKAYKYQLGITDTDNKIRNKTLEIEERKRAAAGLMFSNQPVEGQDAQYADHLAQIVALESDISELQKHRKSQESEFNSFLQRKSQETAPADSDASKESTAVKNSSYDKIDALTKASTIDLSRKMADMKKLGAPDSDISALRAGIQKIKAIALKNVETIAKVPTFESYRVGPLTTDFVSSIEKLHADLATTYAKKRNQYVGLSKEEIIAKDSAERAQAAFEQGMQDARRGKVEEEILADAETIRRHRAENQLLQQQRERIAAQKIAQRTTDMSAFMDNAYPSIIDQERIAREQLAANNQIEMQRERIARHPAGNAGVTEQSAYLNAAQPVEWNEGFSRANTRVDAENNPWTENMGRDVRRAGDETALLDRKNQIENSASLAQKKEMVHELLIRRAKVLKKKIPSWNLINNMPEKIIQGHIDRALSGLYGQDIQATAKMLQERKTLSTDNPISPNTTVDEMADKSAKFKRVRPVKKVSINAKVNVSVRRKIADAIKKLNPVSDEEKQVVQVLKWITPVLEQFKAFSGQKSTEKYTGSGIKIGNVIIPVVTSSESKGSFFHKSNAIVLYAKNITSADDAVETLLHEGLVHFGLSTVFRSTEERTAFMEKIADLYKGTTLSSSIQEAYKNYNISKAGLGEEIIAHQAAWLIDKYPSKFPVTKTTLIQKLKNLIKTLFSKFRLKSPGEKLITDVLSAAAKNLTKSEVKVTAPMRGFSLNESVERLPSAEVWQHKTKTGLESLSGMLSTVWKRAVDPKSADNFLDSEKRINWTAADKVKENLQDYYHPVQVMQRALKQLGGTITLDSNVHATEEAVANKMAERIRQFRGAYVAPLENALKAYARISGVEPKEAQKQIDRYLTASHAAVRNEQLAKRGNTDPAPSGMSTDTANKILKGGEFPVPQELKNIRKLISDISSYQIKLMRRFKLLPEASIKAMEEAYGDNYIPLKGFEEMMDETDKRYRVQKRNAELSMKRATGRSEDSIAQSPLIHSILQTMDIIGAASRAEPGRALLKLIEQNKELRGTENFFVKRADEQPPKFKWITQKDGNLSYEQQKNPFANDERAFTVIDEEGNRVRLLAADKRVANALSGMNMAGTIPIVQMIGKVTRLMAKLATTLNPGFVFTNPIRDMVTAALNITDEKFDSGTYKIDKEPLRRKIVSIPRLLDARKAIAEYQKTMSTATVSPEWRNYLKLFREHGGFSEPFDLNNFESLSKDIQRSIKSAYKSDTGVFAYNARLFSSAVDWLEGMSSSLENMTRLNTFRTLFDAWVAKGMDGNEAAIRAASAARNITVNFSKRGAWAPILSPLFMFSNASIQGVRRMMKTIMRNPGESAKMLLKASAGLIMMHSLNMLMGGDDDDGIPFYQKVPNWVRDNNFILMVPFTGKYVKIPFPYGYNIISTIVNRFFNVATGQESVGTAAIETTYSVFDNFSPIGASGSNWTILLPTVLRPPMQIALNQGYFGQKIMPDVPSWVKHEVPDSTRYWGTVDPIAKFVAWGLNEMSGGSEVIPGALDISPESIEYLVESYAGGLGKFASNISKLIQDMSTATFDPGAVKLDEVMNHIPVARRFMGGVNFYASLELFNEKKGQVQLLGDELKLLRSNGDKTGVKDFLQNNPDYAKQAAIISSIEGKVKKLTKLENAIMKSSAITDSTARLDKIRRQKEQLVKAGLRMLKD